MDFKELGKKIVGLGAPLLGTALGGPVGLVVGKLISSEFGVENHPEAIAKYIEENPAEAQRLLLKIQNDHEEEMAKLANEAKRIDAGLEHAYLGDRVSARERDKEIIKAGKSNTRADLMIIGDVVGLVVCALCAIFGEKLGIGEPGRMFLTTLASYFGLGLRDAHAFEFGSSRGSKEKDDAIKNMVPLDKFKAKETP